MTDFVKKPHPANLADGQVFFVNSHLQAFPYLPKAKLRKKMQYWKRYLDYSGRRKLQKTKLVLSYPPLGPDKTTQNYRDGLIVLSSFV